MKYPLSVGIIGASGYTGEELVRLLSQHSKIRIDVITSRKHVGKALHQIIPKMRNRMPNILFTDPKPEILANSNTELFFLSLPHGIASNYAIPLIKAGKTVIDLSADYRLFSKEAYLDYYDTEHPDPKMLINAPYGLAERTNDKAIKQTPLIACPGCYPTSILLPLLPLVENKIVNTNNIVINSFSGVSGAGKRTSESLLYSECSENTVAYGVGNHRHLSEIEEQLSFVSKSGQKIVVQFTPHLAPMKRGILSTIVLPLDKGITLKSVYKTWHQCYAKKPFICILPSGEYPQTKYVSGTNRIDFSGHYDQRTNNLIITSAIDNLIKGAGGQGIQIMNMKYGFEETDGLL